MELAPFPRPTDQSDEDSMGSTLGPSSATMNGTRCAIRPLIKCTSRDRRSTFATAMEHLRFAGLLGFGEPGERGFWASSFSR
jgi:hypothetical protein